jgi:hypothetical protein
VFNVQAKQAFDLFQTDLMAPAIIDKDIVSTREMIHSFAIPNLLKHSAMNNLRKTPWSVLHTQICRGCKFGKIMQSVRASR